jgi:hypothetical protein
LALSVGVRRIPSRYEYCKIETAIFRPAEERPAILIAGAISFGAAGIIFGVALRRLERYVGRVAELSGLFEIAAALFFVTVALSFVGYLALIPAEILEIILIYKVSEKMQQSERELKNV